MQNTNEQLNLISKGEDYKKLRRSYVIFICKFDPFEENLSRYTFKNLCCEKTRIELKDEAIKRFINPYGDTTNLSKEMQEFLKYLCGKKGESSFVEKVKDEVEKVKAYEKWRLEYMTLEMRDQENIELGKEIGREEGREEIVANMLRKNVHIEQIADLCGVDIKEVLEIQQKMQL